MSNLHYFFSIQRLFDIKEVIKIISEHDYPIIVLNDSEIKLSNLKFPNHITYIRHYISQETEEVKKLISDEKQKYFIVIQRLETYNDEHIDYLYKKFVKGNTKDTILVLFNKPRLSILKIFAESKCNFYLDNRRNKEHDRNIILSFNINIDKFPDKDDIVKLYYDGKQICDLNEKKSKYNLVIPENVHANKIIEQAKIDKINDINNKFINMINNKKYMWFYNTLRTHSFSIETISQTILDELKETWMNAGWNVKVDGGNMYLESIATID